MRRSLLTGAAMALLTAVMLVAAYASIYGAFGLALPGAAPISGPTSVRSSNSMLSAVRCPCLSRQQIEMIFNTSATRGGQAVYNITYISSVQKLLTNNTNATVAALMRNVTHGWAVVYGTPTQYGTSAVANSTMSETVLEANDAVTLYNFDLGMSQANGLQMNSSKSGGFTYSSFNTTINGVTTIAIVGYKDNYMVTLVLASPNRGLYPPSEIAAQINSTT
jgi:hypothetical protein